jgi:hypothetical protein
MRTVSLSCLAVLVTFAAACGSSSSGSDGSSGGGSGDAGGSDGPTTTADGGTIGPNTSALFAGFSHGINTGYWPPFTDDQTSQLASMSGSDAVRVKLPEGFLVQWGYDILVPTMQTRATYGMSNHMSWLCAPTQAHSTAPANGDLEYYIPSNLNEPIFDATGNVNANNYWASYVSQTITTYAPYIKVFSVWNEPDWVSDYSTTQKWPASPPSVADLPRFNGTIFDYARMLRIAKVVAAKISPDVRIATGGLGYPTFLAALAQYSDNPNGGQITADYPAAGIDYVDVLDLHYYPLYTPGNSDAATAGLIAHRDSFAKVLSDAGLPSRPVVYTETGAPHVQVGTLPGSAAYARNYYLKAMVMGQAAGISAIHWFDLSDGADTSSDSYQSMGLYSNLSSAQTVAAGTKTDTGVAATTLGTLTKGLTYSASAQITPPANVTAVTLSGTKRVLIAWATTTDGNEDASASISLPFAADEKMWDYATTNASTSHASGESVALGSDPRFFVEQ